MAVCFRAVWGVLLLTLLPAALSYNLVLIHTNDVHAHIEEMNKYASSCKDSDREKGGCYGGVARRVTKVNEIRDQDPEHTLLLDAGDQFQGTLWFNIYKGQEAARFMNEMKYDAMVSQIITHLCREVLKYLCIRETDDTNTSTERYVPGSKKVSRKLLPTINVF